jgi:hypothetical protein
MMMTAKIVSGVAIVLSVLLMCVGFANLDFHGSREIVSCMAIVLAGALIAFAHADSKK